MARRPHRHCRFAELIATGENDVDTRPVQLAADAFLIGKRKVVEAFEFHDLLLALSEVEGRFHPVPRLRSAGTGLASMAVPRHADGLLVTGVVTRNMARALRETYDAVPAPKVVIAIGDCARNRGLFAGGPGVAGAVGDVLPVDVEIAGCPPSPADIVAGLRRVTRR